MVAQNPPYALQGLNTHDALGMRRALAGFLPASVLGSSVVRGGVHPGFSGRAEVTGSTTTMQVSVASGTYFIPASGSQQGVYAATNEGVVTLNIDPSDPTQYRRDLIIARVQDTFYSDSTNSHTLEVVKGSNSASSPAPLPTQPQRSLLLAIVNVDPGISNLTSKVSDQRTYVGSLGAIPILSTAWPASSPAGLLLFETDTGTLRVADGTSLRFVADAGWKTYTPTIVNGGTATLTSVAGRWKRISEKTVTGSMVMTIANAGNGSSQVGFTLPTTPRRDARVTMPFSGENFTSSSIITGIALCIVSGSGNVADRIRAAGPWGAARNLIGTDLVSGAILSSSFTYEEL